MCHVCKRKENGSRSGIGGRTMQKIKDLKVQQRGLLVFLLAILLMTSVSAWFDNLQHKTNRFKSEGLSQDVVVTLRGYSNDKESFEGLLEGGVFELYDASSNTKLGDRQYRTDSKGEVWIHNLPEGTYYLKEVTPPVAYAYDKDSLEEDIIEYRFAVTDGTQIHVPKHIDVDNIRIDVSLTVSKYVENRSGSSLSDTQKDELFSFEVKFNEYLDDESFEDPKEYEYQIDSGAVRTIRNGGVILLKHGQKAHFKNLPYGIRYAVREIFHPEYSVESKDTSGMIRGHVDAIFINRPLRTPESYLNLTKILRNGDDSELSDLQKEKLFEFVVRFDSEEVYQAVIDDGESFEIRNGDSVFLKHEETLYVSGLPQGLHYSIQEKLVDGEHYYPDIEELTGSVVHESSLIKHQVVNTYDEAPTGTGTLLVTKHVPGEERDDDFIFGIFLPDDLGLQYTIDDGDLISYDSSETITLKHGQVFKIEGIPLGTKYRIEEEALPEYSQEFESVEGYIILGETKHIFINHHELDLRTASLTVTKIVEGVETSQSFDFTLKVNYEEVEFSLKDGESKTFEITQGSTYLLKEEDYSSLGYITTITKSQGVVDGEEHIEIDVINTFDPYLVTTQVSGEKTWTVPDGRDDLIPEYILVQILNDKDEVLDEKLVTKDDDGKWLYEFEVPKYNPDGSEAMYHVHELEIPNFEVEYEGMDIHSTYLEPARYRPKVLKHLENEVSVTDKMVFDFILSGTSKETALTNLRNYILGSGEVSFSELIFDSEGVYTYRIQEVVIRDTDYEFDIRDVSLEITVIRVGNRFVVDKVVYRKEGHEDSLTEANFYNVYLLKPVVPKDPIPDKTKPEVPTPDKPKPEKLKPDKGNLPQSGIADSLTLLYSEVSIIVGYSLVGISNSRRKRGTKNVENNSSI